jgi:hypothetical protein
MNNNCRGHRSGHGANKYKCSSLACLSGKQWMKYLERELKKTEHGMDGLCQVNGQWRSEHLDISQAA